MPPAATVAPYGTWTSPVSAERLVEQAVAVMEVQAHDGRAVWNERRPAEAGRYVIVDETEGELLPAGFSARTQVHEYGGRCWTFAGADLISSNWEDQRLWRFRPGAEPEPVTAEPPAPRAVRFADPVATADGRWLICVRERHTREPHRVDNDLVAVPLLAAPAEPRILAEGHDFYAAPAVSPDGTRLAWVTWDHPQMPWDATELWVADLVDGVVMGAERVAGDNGESVQQPCWSPDGQLHWVSDRTGWWNLYREGEPLCAMPAEFGGPPWAFGQSTSTFLDDGTLVASWHGPEGSGLGIVAGGGLIPIPTPYTSFGQLAGAGNTVLARASSATEPAAVVRVTLDGAVRILRRTREIDLPLGSISVAQHLRFPVGEEEAWAWYYPPTNAEFEGPPGERPPLIVTVHGGPTSSAEPSFDIEVQYWTSRGFALVDVDYRGSTGYGREYRNRLRGNWGVTDLEDVVAATRFLADRGLADGERAVIRGGSAGGYTTLAALAFTDAFAAGASYFGISDLSAILVDSHKFEARYGDTMIGPWPEAEATYRERSPLFHLEGFDRPLLLLQGLEDVVVPPAQSEVIFEALKEKGVPVGYLAFAGEQHGFRKAETIIAATTAELSFYGLVLGFTPDGAVDVPMENF